jgi:DNA-binding response OmpR family regulator
MEVASLGYVAQAPVEEESFRVANLEFRPRSAEVLAGTRRVGLTVREFQTLFVLVQRSDRVVTRPQIYELVWGGAMNYRNRSVDVFIRKIRRKLEAVEPEWTYIHTHFGVGYRFAPVRLRAGS